MRLILKIAAAVLALILLLAVALAIYIYATAITPSRPVGLQQIEAADPGHRPIPITLWYPTTAKPSFALLGTAGQRVASDGPVDGRRLPLVVITHGTGGGAMSHADTAIALAENGFVVAAVTHPGDNFRDQSIVGSAAWLPDRTRHVERTIDAVLGQWSGRAHVDPRRIGLFGFSAGGTTVLIAIGGTPDLRRIATTCAQRPEFACRLMKPDSYRNAAPVAWRADPRIAAAVVAAPGLGFTFAPDGLNKVAVPVQLWAGAADDSVPYRSNAELVLRALPKGADWHLVPNAQHFTFLAPCGLIGPPMLCRDAKGFDRAQFHKHFNRSVVAFFKQAPANPADRLPGPAARSVPASDPASAPQ